MLSQEELKQSMNKHLASLIVEQLSVNMETRMQKQWDTVVFELASTRKSNESLKKTVVELREALRRLETGLQRWEAKGRDSEETRLLKLETLQKLSKYLEDWK